MSRRATTIPKTFVGPITVDKSGGKPPPAMFYVLQSTSGMLKLEYASKAEAQHARNQLLKSRGVYRVGSNPLLEAIRMALNEATINVQNPQSSGDESGDETPSD